MTEEQDPGEADDIPPPGGHEDGSRTVDDPGRGFTDDPERRFTDDPERVAFLREIADDIRGESSESEQVAAILYRVSDLYDPAEETTPEDIYLNMRNILRVVERGGLPDRDD